MRSFDPNNGYDSGAMEQLIAKVQDIKASPKAGQKRLVVREKGTNFTHAIIDIDMKASRDLKSKETYVFQVREKDDSSNPGFQRKRSSEFKSFLCADTPEAYSLEFEKNALFNRFGGGGGGKGAKRTKF
jgi:hypothetical protein